MQSYFGYVEREADSYVNWADVGRNMSATIDNIQRVRDEKKALIEKAYREDLDYIQSRPSGEHETLNAWSLNFGNTSAENLKLKYNMLKQGKINVNEFVTFRQNLSDAVEKIYTVNGQLQEAFKKVNDRTKAGENQELERATKVLLEKYGALENTLPYVNSLTGSVAIGLTEITKDAEGKEVRKLRQGDDAYLTPQQLQAAAMQEFNAYNEQADLDKWVESLGDVQQDMRQIGGETLAGLILSVTDVTSEAILARAKELPEGSKLSDAQMTELENYVKTFNQGETDYINGILANPFNASALLTDRIKINPKTKQPYNIVFNKADQKTSNDLYVEKTSAGEFKPIFDETEIGKEQKDQLRSFLKNQLRAKYDRKTEMQPYNEPRKEREPRYQPNSEDYRASREAKSAGAMGTYIRDLWSGDMAKKQQTLRTLQGDGEVMPSGTYFKTGKGKEVFLHITRKSDGESTDIKMTNADGTPSGDVTSFGRAAASWLYASDVSKKVLLENDAEFVNSLNVTPNFTPFNPNQKDEPLWDRPVVEEPKEREPIGVTAFTKYQDNAASDLNSQVERYGLTVKGTASMPGYHRVAIFDKTGKKLSGDIKVGYPSDPKGAAEAAKNFNEQLNDILKRQGGGGSGELDEK